MSASGRGSAWSEFWRQKGSGGTNPGCLPRGGAGIAQVQSAVWRQFALSLPQGVRVVDIATGDGRVMAWLLAARPDLIIEGVDLADGLPPPPPGARSRGGIAMESLPLADRSVEAAVSQFGFEYGETAAAAAELGRIIAPGGTVALLTHRVDGPIVAQNRHRAQGIGWATEGQQLPALAHAAIDARPDGAEAVPPHIAQAPQRASQLFGARSAAWEIAEAIRMTLDLGRADDPETVRALIEQISAKATNELARIAELEAAAARIADEAALGSALAAAGLAPIETHALYDRQGPAAFADFRLIARPS